MDTKATIGLDACIFLLHLIGNIRFCFKNDIIETLIKSNFFLHNLLKLFQIIFTIVITCICILLFLLLLIESKQLLAYENILYI